MIHRIILLLFFFAIAFVSGGAQSRDPLQNPSDKSQDIPIIDVHTHASFTSRQKQPAPTRTPEQYFREWQEGGIWGAVVHTGADGIIPPALAGKNIVSCIGVGPGVNAARIEAGLKAGKYGCIKVYLGYVHMYAFDKRYDAIYELAQKYDVPVVFHTGDTNSTKAKLKYADPLTIDEVAVDHPKVKFVIAHCGNPWIESAAEVAYKNPNVYLECSALLIGNLDEMPKEKVETFVIKPISWVFGYLENPQKLMFGTDWPLTNIKSYVDAYKQAIPKEHWKAVFYENALRVFKFPARKESNTR